MAVKYMEDSDPEWRKRLEEEREQMRKEFGSATRTVRICARCGHALAILHRGYHGAEEIKCPKCKFQNFFTPVQFRIA